MSKVQEQIFGEIIISMSIPPSNIVIFINVIHNRHYKRVRRILQSLISRAKNYKLICFNMECPVFLDGLKTEPKLSEEYLSDDDYKSIDKHVMQEVSKNWYFFSDDKYEDITKFRGIHLGRLVEYNFQQFLIPRIKNLFVANKALNENFPNGIVVIEDTDELTHVVKFLAQLKKIPCSVFKFTPSSHTFLIRLKKSLRNWLAYVLTLILNFISGKLLEIDKNSNERILIDKKFFDISNAFHNSKFLLTSFDQGLRVRWDLLMKKLAYLPFCFTDRKCLSVRQRPFANRWKKLRLHRSFRDYFIFQDISYWHLVSSKLAAFYLEFFPRIEKNMRIAEKFIRRKKIKAVLLRHDMREFERTVITVAKQQDIPALVVQHGIVAEENFIDFMFADATFIWGDACRDWFKLKDERKKLFVTGNPRYDVCFNWKPSNQRVEFFNNLKLDPKKTTILFATQAIVKFSSYRTDDENEILTKKLLDFFKITPQYQLIVKIHPYEDEKVYKHIFKGYGLSNVRLLTDINIFELIVHSDLLITKNSTTGLEAMIFDKPLITIELAKRRDQVPYGEKGAAISIHSAEEIADAIKISLEDTKTKEFLRDNRLSFVDNYAYKIDGLASQRVIDKLDKILVKGLKNTSD